MSKAKPYIILFLTLLIGIAIGVLGSGRFVKHKIESMRNMQTKEGMVETMEKMLDLNPDQVKLVRPVLEEHSLRMRELWKDHRKERRAEMDKLFDALEPVLNDEQADQLRTRMRRILMGIHGPRRPGDRGMHKDKPPRD